MHILLAHEYYQIRGGEDEYFETRRDLLRARGHRITEYVRRNQEIAQYGALQKLTLAARTTWAWDANRELLRLLAEAQPDVAHFSNTFPLMSPSVYYVCRRAGVPVVQNLENSRMICPASTFFRDGKPCHDCVGKFPWPAVVHSCYRGSAAQSAVLASTISVHRLLGTWTNNVDAFLVATEFHLQKFAESGLPRQRLYLCPLPVADAGARQQRSAGEYGLFLGRLSPEKGLLTLLDAWKTLDIPLKIAGSGPMEADVRQAASGNRNIEFVGRVSGDPKYQLIRGARFLVWPSLGEFETFGLVVAEAYSCGVPVLASRTGVAPEMVQDGRTGTFFAANDAADLARAARWGWDHPQDMMAMGADARRVYESRFTFDQAYRRWMAIYASVLPRMRPSAEAVTEAHASGR